MQRFLARMRSFLAAIRRPRQLGAEMEEEMRFHIAMEAERIAREEGVGAEEARRRAVLAFGGVEQRKEEGWDARGRTRWSSLSLDAKLAWRMLWKSPALTVVGVLSMALGIAVGVGFFVFFSAHFYPRLPLDEGDRIVALENHDVETNTAERPSSDDFVAWREQVRSIEPIGAFVLKQERLIVSGAPARPVRVAEMSASGFRVARVPPLLGRTLIADDERPGSPDVAVVGNDVWRTRFDGDPDIVGRVVYVGDAEHVIVGVMPPGFEFPKSQELWVPLRIAARAGDAGEDRALYVFGRLVEGMTRAQAQAELTALGARTAAAFPETHAHLRPRVLPYTYPIDDVQGLQLWEAAQIQSMVNLLLVAIAANVAVLVYARTAIRQGEIAVRTALGASRGRIVAQLFVEALLLSLLAAGLGVAAAHFILQELAAIFDAARDLGFWIDYGLQPRSVAFAIALAVFAAVIVGVVPALKSTGRRLHADLRTLGGGASPRLGRAWTALIVAQVAVAVAILPATLSTGFREMRWLALRATFPADEVIAASVGLAVPLRPGLDAAAYQREVAARIGDRIVALESRLEADPAVAGATIAGTLADRSDLIEVEGFPSAQPSGAHTLEVEGVGIDHFATLGLPVVAGRDFRSSDASVAGGIIVNEAFARRILAGAPALGRRLRFLPPPDAAHPGSPGEPGPWLEIVGVVPNQYESALDPEWASPMAYYAIAPGQVPWATVLVRVRGNDADGYAPALRQTVAALDPDLRIGSVYNLAVTQAPRYLAVAVTAIVLVLGIVVMLSAAGIHALISLTVTRRRREIGIRTALGAQPGRVLAGVLARAAWQLGLGGLIGAGLGAWLLGWTRAKTLGGVAIPLTVVVAIVLLAGLVAAAGPARRGLRIQPMEALRQD